MSQLSKNDLVNLIKSKHHDLNGRDISPIKLQKSLYFLFAFWGGFIRKANTGQTEVDFSMFDENLFESNFEAWTYGPVDKEVYFAYKDGLNFDKTSAEKFLSDLDEYVREFINSFLARLFNSSDFGLVDLSHRDEVWKRNSEKLTKNMPAEEIIAEYATKT